MKKGIISYDITSNKYRNELSKILKVYGKRIQFSVFEFELSSSEYKDMIYMIRKFYETYVKHYLFDVKAINEISIRIYPICEKCSQNIVILENKHKKQDEEVIII